jgi:hypothetical protein
MTKFLLISFCAISISACTTPQSDSAKEESEVSKTDTILLEDSIYVHIDATDLGSGKDVTHLWAGYKMRGSILFPKGFNRDSAKENMVVTADNGVIKQDDNSSYFYILKPDRPGKMTVTAYLSLNTGTVEARTTTFNVLPFPKVYMHIKENNIRTNGTVDFSLVDEAENIIPDTTYVVGYCEYQIIGKDGQLKFETPGGGRDLNLDYGIKHGLVVENGDTLKVSSVRLQHRKYNLPAHTEPFSTAISFD